jgi:hypothetical protein
MPRTIYRAAAGAFTLFAVGMQYWLLVRDESGAEVVATSIKFFSFFTILANLLAAAALLWPIIAPRTAAAMFFARPTVRTAIAGYMIMVGVVYYLLLVGVSGRTGWSLVFEHLLHAVTPPLFVADWLLFVDKRALDWRGGIRALAFPLAYAGFTLVRGAATGWYPYPFVDVNDLGYASVLANIVGLIIMFFIVEAALALVGRRIGTLAD